MGVLVIEIDLNAFPKEVHEADISDVLKQVYPAVKVTGESFLYAGKNNSVAVGRAYFNSRSMKDALRQAQIRIQNLEEENSRLQIRSNY